MRGHQQPRCHGGRNASDTVLRCNGPVLTTGPHSNFKLNINMFTRLKQFIHLSQTQFRHHSKQKFDAMQVRSDVAEDAKQLFFRVTPPRHGAGIIKDS